MTLQSPKFGLSQSNRRVEDDRLLTGHGAYVDDTAPAGALHAYVLRSSVAHGEIAALDVGDARGMPGVVAVMVAADLAAAGIANDLPTAVARNADGSKAANPKRPILAEGRVRFVGEPVAFVVAESLGQARDAAEAIEVETTDLPVKMDVAEGGPAVHDLAPDNVSYRYEKGDAAACDAALAAAAHRVTLEVDDTRIICASLEPRGTWAEMEGGRLHVCVNGQGVWGQRDQVADSLGMEKADVRVTNPDVGGGFGMKAMSYPETILVAAAAKALGRPVRWMADRSESMLSDNAGRDLVCTAELGFDADMKIVAYRQENVANMGAYHSGYAQHIQSELFSKVMPGVYDVQACHMVSVGVFTNTTQVDAYRGAGRPEAIYVLERAMDYAARELGVDRFELRRKSFIQPEQFPYLSAMGETYDVGDFGRVLGRAETEGEVAGFE
ncbi:MAG: molybdopterin cofactor-binding domain-containing protein, partial [Pseudomonadota bacterium]